jgi:hypothetical protein
LNGTHQHLLCADDTAVLSENVSKNIAGGGGGQQLYWIAATEFGLEVTSETAKRTFTFSSVPQYACKVANKSCENLGPGVDSASDRN